MPTLVISVFFSCTLIILEYMCSGECSGSVYEEYDPLDFLYGEQESPKDPPVYASIGSRKGAAVGDSLPSPLTPPSPLPKTFPPPLALRKKTNTVNVSDTFMTTYTNLCDFSNLNFCFVVVYYYTDLIIHLRLLLNFWYMSRFVNLMHLI